MDPNTDSLSSFYFSPPAGIRLLGGDVTDVVEARALSFKPQYVDVYLASWGPEDNGVTLEGPGPLALLALENGIKRVRTLKSVCTTLHNFSFDLQMALDSKSHCGQILTTHTHMKAE